MGPAHDAVRAELDERLGRQRADADDEHEVRLLPARRLGAGEGLARSVRLSERRGDRQPRSTTGISTGYGRSSSTTTSTARATTITRSTSSAGARSRSSRGTATSPATSSAETARRRSRSLTDLHNSGYGDYRIVLYAEDWEAAAEMGSWASLDAERQGDLRLVHKQVLHRERVDLGLEGRRRRDQSRTSTEARRSTSRTAHTMRSAGPPGTAAATTAGTRTMPGTSLLVGRGR